MDYQRYIYWQDGDMWLGYLERYPDYWTQGKTQEELRENLRDLYGELTGGHILCVREAAVLEIESVRGHRRCSELLNGRLCLPEVQFRPAFDVKRSDGQAGPKAISTTEGRL